MVQYFFILQITCVPQPSTDTREAHKYGLRRMEIFLETLHSHSFYTYKRDRGKEQRCVSSTECI